MPQSSRNTLHRTTLMPVGAGGGRPGGVMCVCVVRAADPLRRRACESDRGRIYYGLRVVRFYVYVSRARSFAK